MRFALLGNHPAGVEMTSALVASGRYQLAAYTAPVADAVLQSWGAGVRKLQDLEEVLADPQIELVIVAGVEANRPAQLRRALQAERHVLAVHPADRSPEIAYEAGMIQKDTGCVLLPLLAESFHPAVARLRSLLAKTEEAAAGNAALGRLTLLEMVRPAPKPPTALDAAAERKPDLPGWDVLRVLGGEIAEVSAFAAHEMARATEPLLVSGRFERGGLFHMTLMPEAEDACRVVIHGTSGRAELLFPQGWRGPAFLTYGRAGSSYYEEAWEAWDPWATLLVQLDHVLASKSVVTSPAPGPECRISWEDEIRCLELDDAARRSVERRRSSVLEYQEANEEVGFKGTMTLLGCGLMWGLLLLLLVLAVGVQGLKSTKAGLESMLPQGIEAATCVGLLFGVPLVLFLLLQLLRLAARKEPTGTPDKK